MNDKYKQLLNIYDEDNLRINIDGAAYYILLFEAFKDMVDSCVKFFYQTEEIVDGKLICRISKEYRIDVSSKKYKKANGKFSRDEFYSQLIWLKDRGVIKEGDIHRLLEIRKRRNSIVHELLKVLADGLDTRDAELLGDLMKLYMKIDNWFFKIDMQILGKRFSDEYDIDNAQSLTAMHLMSIFRIVFNGEGKGFKEAMQDIIVNKI